MPLTRAAASSGRRTRVPTTVHPAAVVLTVLLGWPYQATTILVGGAVIVYTVTGGIKAVTWTDVQQMMIIFLGLFVVAIAFLATLLIPELPMRDRAQMAKVMASGAPFSAGQPGVKAEMKASSALASTGPDDSNQR